jgi:hypothetical protein
MTVVLVHRAYHVAWAWDGVVAALGNAANAGSNDE